MRIRYHGFLLFSERELCCRPSVCLSSVRNVRAAQAIEIFGNVSMPFGTLAIPDLSVKISRRLVPNSVTLDDLERRNSPLPRPNFTEVDSFRDGLRKSG